MEEPTVTEKRSGRVEGWVGQVQKVVVVLVGGLAAWFVVHRVRERLAERRAERSVDAA